MPEIISRIAGASRALATLGWTRFQFDRGLTSPAIYWRPFGAKAYWRPVTGLEV